MKNINNLRKHLFSDCKILILASFFFLQISQIITEIDLANTYENSRIQDDNVSNLNQYKRLNNSNNENSNSAIKKYKGINGLTTLNQNIKDITIIYNQSLVDKNNLKFNISTHSISELKNLAPVLNYLTTESNNSVNQSDSNGRLIELLSNVTIKSLQPILTTSINITIQNDGIIDIEKNKINNTFHSNVTADLTTLNSNYSKTLSNDLTTKYDNTTNVWQNLTSLTKIETVLTNNTTAILTTGLKNLTENRNGNQPVNNDENDYNVAKIEENENKEDDELVEKNNELEHQNNNNNIDNIQKNLENNNVYDNNNENEINNNNNQFLNDNNQNNQDLNINPIRNEQLKQPVVPTGKL